MNKNKFDIPMSGSMFVNGEIIMSFKMNLCGHLSEAVLHVAAVMKKG